MYREPVYNKRIVFLDELPWMDAKRSDFKSALDLFWNTYASTKEDLILIVCGSATSRIMKNMVKDEGGFYNRITRKIHLLPFSLNECLLYSKYLNLNYNEKQVIDCYMVFGGVPYYWELINNELSLAQNIDNLCALADYFNVATNYVLGRTCKKFIDKRKILDSLTETHTKLIAELCMEEKD